MDLLIRNGTVVTATETFRTDIGVQNGVIARLGVELEAGAARRVIDAAGRLVLPGGVDTHTPVESASMGLPTADTFTTGTIAAARGGTTTIVDFCRQNRGQSLEERLLLLLPSLASLRRPAHRRWLGLPVAGPAWLRARRAALSRSFQERPVRL